MANQYGDPATVTIDLTAVEDKPVASVAATHSFEEGGFVLIEATATDVDPGTTAMDFFTAVEDVPVGESAIFNINKSDGYTCGWAGNLMATCLVVSAPNIDDWTGITLPRDIQITATDLEGNTSDVVSTAVTVVAVNDPPVADNVTIAAGLEEEVQSFSFSGADPDNDTLYLHSVNLPADFASKGTLSSYTVFEDGVTASSTLPHSMTFTPAEDWAGTVSFTYRIHDNTGTATAISAPATVQIDIIATLLDVPVIVESPGVVNFDEGSSASFTLTATDVDSDDVTFSITEEQLNGQDELTIAIVSNAKCEALETEDLMSACVTIGTVDADWNGSRTISISASDAQNNTSAIETPTVTVGAINDPPVAYSVGTSGNPIPATEDTYKDITLNGDDIDTGTLYLYSLTIPDGFPGTITLPDGSAYTTQLDDGGGTAFDGSDELVVRFNPTDDYFTPSGQYFTFTYKMWDGELESNTATVYLKVNPVNDPPVFTADPADMTFDEDTTEHQFIISATDVDDSVGTLIFNAVEYSDLSGALSNDLTIAVAQNTPVDDSATITITPDEDFNGTRYVYLTVSDNDGDYDEYVMTVTVNPVNDAPTFDADISDPAAVDEDDSDINITSIAATDIDGDEVDFYIINAANFTYSFSNKVKNGNNTTTDLTIDPANNFSGTQSVTIRVSDADYNSNDSETYDEQTFTITVNPVIDDATLPAISDINVTQEIDSTISNITISDPDIDTGIFGRVTYNLDASTSDGSKLTAEIINHDDLTNDTTFDVLLSPQIIANTDMDGVTVTITLTKYNNGSQQNVNSTTFTATLVNVYDPPILNDVDADIQYTEETDFQVTMTVTNPDYDIVDFQSTAPIIVTNTSNFLFTLNSQTNYTVVWDVSPADDFFGTETITAQIEDAYGNTSQGEFTLVGEDVADAPNVPIPYDSSGDLTSISFDEDTSYTFYARATDPDDPTYAGDLDFEITQTGSNLSITTTPDTGYSSGGEISDTLSVKIVITNAVEHFNGTETIKMRSHDGAQYSDYSEITVTVDPVNDPPIISAISDPSAFDEEGSTAVELTATDTTDLNYGENQQAEFNVIENNGVFDSTISSYSYDSGTGVTTAFISIVPVTDWCGTYTITMRASDDGEYDSSDATTYTETTFDINVTCKPDDAEIDPIEDAQQTNQGVPLTIPVTISDPDTGTGLTGVTYNISVPSADGAIAVAKTNHSGNNSINFDVIVTPVTLVGGSTSFSVDLEKFVNGVSQNTHSEGFNLTVVDVYDIPQIETYTASYFTEEIQNTISFDVTNPDTATFSILVSDGNHTRSVITTGGAQTFDNFDIILQSGSTPTSFVLLITPLQDFDETDIITVELLDAAGNYSDPENISISVTGVNDPPVIGIPSAGSEHSYIEGADTSVSFTVYGTDVEGTDITISATENATSDLVISVENDVTCDGYTPLGAACVTVSSVDSDFFGTRYVDLVANDGELDSAVVQVDIVVVNVNDPAHVDDKAITFDEDETNVELRKVTLTATDPDIAVDTLYLNSINETGLASLLTITNEDGTQYKTYPSYGASADTLPLTLLISQTQDVNGDFYFDYDVHDGTEVSENTGTVTITIDPVDDIPVMINPGNQGYDEGGSTSFTISATDPDTTDLEFYATELIPDNQSAELSIAVTQDKECDGTVDYQQACVNISSVNADFNGSKSVQLYAKQIDPNDNSITEVTSNVITISVIVGAVNDPPYSGDITIADAVEDINYTITLTGADVEGDTIYLHSFDTSSLYGTLSGYNVYQDASNPGSELSSGILDIIYDPTDNFNGTTSFKYKIHDNKAENSISNWITVNITVGSVPDKPVITVPSADPSAINEGSTFVITFTATDVDNTTSDVTFDLSNSDAGMEISLTQDYKCDFTSDPFSACAMIYTTDENFNGTKVIRVTATDTDSVHSPTTSDEVSFNLTWSGVNDAPVADDITTQTNEETAVEITLTGTDIDNDTMYLHSINTSGLMGTLTKVDDSPYQEYVDPSNPGDDITALTLKFTPDTNFPATFPSAVYSEPTTFTYKIHDNQIGVLPDIDTISSDATVTINVFAINDLPRFTDSAGNDAIIASYLTIDDTGITEDNEITGITIYARDADADTLDIYCDNLSDLGNLSCTRTATSFSATAANQSAVFTISTAPTPNYFSTGIPDVITFYIDDGHGTLVSESISIIINSDNDLPNTNPGSFSVDEDGVQVPYGLPVASDVETTVANLVYIINSLPAYGNLDDSGNNSVTVNSDLPSRFVKYTPMNPNYQASDSFTYSVRDEDGGISNISTITINYTAIFDNVVASDQTYTFPETQVDGAIALSYSDPDINNEGDTITLKITSLPSYGTLKDSDGNLISVAPYTLPSENITFTGTEDDPAATSGDPAHNDTIEWSATDTNEYSNGVGSTDTATVYLTITPVNDGPIISVPDERAELNEGFSTTVAVSAVDPDNPTLIFTCDSEFLDVNNDGINDVECSVTYSGQNATYTFTSISDYFGDVDYPVTVSDGSLTDSADVLLKIINVNDAPIAYNDIINIFEDPDAFETIVLSASDIANENSTLTYYISELPAMGHIYYSNETQINAVDVALSSNVLLYKPSQDLFGIDTFKFYVIDDSGVSETNTSNEATITINIESVIDNPVFQSGISTPYQPTIQERGSDTFKINTYSVEDDAQTAFEFESPTGTIISPMLSTVQLSKGTLACTDYTFDGHNNEVECTYTSNLELLNDTTEDMITVNAYFTKSYYNGEAFVYNNYYADYPRQITYTINAINDPPTGENVILTIDEKMEDGDANATHTIDLTTDPEGQTVTIVDTSSNIQIQDNGNILSSASANFSRDGDVVTFNPGLYRNTNTSNFCPVDISGDLDDTSLSSSTHTYYSYYLQDVANIDSEINKAGPFYICINVIPKNSPPLLTSLPDVTFEEEEYNASGNAHEINLGRINTSVLSTTGLNPQSPTDESETYSYSVTHNALNSYSAGDFNYDLQNGNVCSFSSDEKCLRLWTAAHFNTTEFGPIDVTVTITDNGQSYDRTAFVTDVKSSDNTFSVTVTQKNDTPSSTNYPSDTIAEDTIVMTQLTTIEATEIDYEQWPSVTLTKLINSDDGTTCDGADISTTSYSGYREFSSSVGTFQIHDMDYNTGNIHTSDIYYRPNENVNFGLNGWEGFCFKINDNSELPNNISSEYYYRVNIIASEDPPQLISLTTIS